VTSFLRKQVLARGLDKPAGMGRIWRVVSAKAERAKAARLDQAVVPALVEALASENGWTRDSAQRLLVEEHESSAEAHKLLRESATFSKKWFQRVHALWALAGMRGLTKDVAQSALGNEDARVRCVGVQVSERLASEDPALLVIWKGITKVQPGGALVLRQVVLSLGNVKTGKGLELLLELMREGCEWEEVRTAAASGLGGRELEALVAIAQAESWRAVAPGRAEFLQLLARCLAREARGDRVEGLAYLCDQGLAQAKWQQDAVVRGVLEGRPKDALGKPTWIRLARKPAVLPEALEGAFAWPGKAGAEELKVRDLSSEELARFEKGRALYESTCVQCHFPSGLGQTGQAPPLRSSPWVLGKDVRTARILLHGLRGEVEIDGERWDGEMPSVSFPDDDIASILTYIRREWGHGAEPVLPATIKGVREATKGRTQPWTLNELEQINE
jgi:mono/diheme cytochrome c family protein